MDWEEAQRWIRARVKVGTDLNTPKSTYRFVEAVDAPITSSRYGYQNERGFRVRIGKGNVLKIPWGMLRTCFLQLRNPGGYDGTFFRKHFPLQAADHGCHIHVVGQILVAAGLAHTEGNRYLPDAQL